MPDRCQASPRSRGLHHTVRPTSSQFCYLGRMVRVTRVLLFLVLIAVPASAQRLPGNVVPEHYSLWFAPDLEKETFRGRESIDVVLTEPSTTVTLHAAEIDFSEVTITSGGTNADGARHARRPARDRDVHRPAADRRGQGNDPDRLLGDPQRQVARLLHQQGKRTEVRRLADGSDRRAPRISLVRRARVQGDVRHLDDDRFGRHGDLQRQGSSRTRRDPSQASTR